MESLMSKQSSLERNECHPTWWRRKQHRKRRDLQNGALRTLWIACLLWPAAGIQERTVENTAQFRDAFLDPTVSHIRLRQGLTLTSEEWGLIRPSIDRKVVVSPAEGINGEIELDLGAHSDLAFITESGELEFRNFRLHQLISFAIGGIGSVHIANQFHAAPKTTIHIHSGTMCLSEGLCSAMSNDVRQAAAALLALGTNLETFDCSIQALSEPGPSFTQIYSDCLMPQDFSGDAPGLVHLHDTTISCTEECRNRGELSSGIPTVELSTGDSRQVVAALTNLALESMHLKIKLLDSLSIASNILSGPISIHVERHGSILSIDGLLDGNILAHMIFKTEGVIFIASTGFRVELMNMVLVMNWFGPGLFSKEIGIFPTCDEDEYIFKWPLFFPHLLFLEGSSLLIANTSMVYKECPYNLDFDEFIASLLMFKETAGARDYGDIYVAEPEIDVQKIGNIGIFFKKLTLELISLSRDSSNGTYSYTGGKVRVEVQNSNVVCETFGRRVIDTPRCAGESNDSNTEETGKAEIGKTMTRSAAMLNKCKGASFLTIALLLFQMGF